MRIPRIYFNQSLSPKTTFQLNEATSHRLLSVLRIDIGDPIIVFNGDGYNYPASIANLRKKSIEIIIQDKTLSDLESSLNIHLGQVISKHEHMEFTLQKAVELGVKEISPLYAERCEFHLKGERLEKKMEHWQRIIIHATEQCGRTTLALLNNPIPLEHWIGEKKEKNLLLLDPKANQGILQVPMDPNHPSVALLVGAEGGLSDEEINRCNRHGFLSVHVGPRVLRTETASLAAITLLQGRGGDLKE